MKNYLFGPNGLATKIVHTRYLSRWIVMGIDVVLSTLVTVFAYWLIRFVREEPRDAFHHITRNLAFGDSDGFESDYSLPFDSCILPTGI